MTDSRIQRWDGAGWRTTLQPLTIYTPAYTGLSVGAGTSVGSYSRCEHTVTAQGEVTLGAGGGISAGSPVTATLPVAAATVDQSGFYFGQPGIRQIGIAAYYDTSASLVYHGSVDANITIPGQITFYSSPGTYVWLAPTNPFTWEVGDQLWWKITYDAAEETYANIVEGPDPVTFDGDQLIYAIT